jgi:hypothetical protein
VSLLLERPAQEVGASAGFHANYMDLPVRREAQQLRSREPLAHDYLAAFIQTYQVKTRLAEIDADRVYLHEMPPPFIFYTCSGVKAADHPISYLFSNCFGAASQGHHSDL